MTRSTWPCGGPPCTCRFIVIRDTQLNFQTAVTDQVTESHPLRHHPEGVRLVAAAADRTTEWGVPGTGGRARAEMGSHDH